MGKGFITLDREIMTHWIWDNPIYYKAWTQILMTVNYKPEKSLIKGQLFECERGQKLYSLNTWVSVLGKDWSLQRLRTFFNLLSKCEMIELENLSKTTRLTVCNYNTYQNSQHDSNTLATRCQHDSNILATTSKVKAIKTTKTNKDNKLNTATTTTQETKTNIITEPQTKYAVAEAVKKKKCISTLYHDFISNSVDADIKTKRKSIPKSEVYSWLDRLLMKVEPDVIRKGLQSCRWPYKLEKLEDFILSNTSTDDEMLNELIG